MPRTLAPAAHLLVLVAAQHPHQALVLALGLDYGCGRAHRLVPELVHCPLPLPSVLRPRGRCSAQTLAKIYRREAAEASSWVGLPVRGVGGGRQEETHAQCRECPTLMSDSDDDKPLGCGPPRLSAPRAAAIMARAGPRRGSPASRLSARLPRAPRRRAGRQAGRRGTARAWGGGVRSAWRQRLPLASARGYERAERTLSRERGRAWRERGRARGHLFRCSGSHHVCPHPRPCGFACHPRPVRAASVSPWPGARSAAVKSEVRLRDLGARTAVCDGLRGGAAGLRGCRSGRGGAVGGRASIGSLCSLIRVRLVHMRRRSSPPPCTAPCLRTSRHVPERVHQPLTAATLGFPARALARTHTHARTHIRAHTTDLTPEKGKRR